MNSAMIAYPERLQLAQLPTPLEPLERLSQDLGGPEIWIKHDDLTGTLLSGNKVRKLEFSIAKALREQADCLVTVGGLQSNHCRATAIAAVRLGLKCHLVLRGQPEAVPEGNHFLDKVIGASVEYHDAEEFSKNQPVLIEEAMKRLRREGRRPFFIPMGASDEVGMWGYIAAAEELLEQAKHLRTEFDHVVVATGSGGTQAGLTVGMRLLKSKTKVWGVPICDSVEFFREKISADFTRWRAHDTASPVSDLPKSLNFLDGYIGEGYGLTSDEVWATIRLLAHREGVLLDPVYTGKAFHGLIKEINKGTFRRGERVVFVHTGGIFGLLARRAEFPFDS